MTWQVVTKRSFDKEFGNLTPDTQKRIAPVLSALATSPFPAGCKKLRGSGDYRLRIGDYRVLYEVDGEAGVVRLLSVGHRRDVYRHR